MPANAPDDIEVARVAGFLKSAGFEPVIVGGMALSVHGSSRATMDCDYAMKKSEEAIRGTVRAMIKAGYGVIFRWDEEKYEPLPKGVVSDESAVSWAVIDEPESVWFWNAETKIRIDLIFDIPMPFDDLRVRAERLSIAGQSILLASLEDLLRMKEVSVAHRKDPFKKLADEQDLVFLRGLLAMEKEDRR